MVSSHRATAWSIDFTDWLNAEASCDVAGEATVLFDFTYNMKNLHKRSATFKYPLYHVQFGDLKPRASENVRYSYADITAERGITFVDFSLVRSNVCDQRVSIALSQQKSLNSMPQPEINRVHLSENMNFEHPTDYPLLSLNKVNKVTLGEQSDT